MTDMTPIDWAKRPIQKYADFSGRAPRAEYWWFVLAMVILFVLLTIVESIVGLNKMVFGVYGPLTTLLWLGVLVPSLSVGVRRLHDTNRSGWWLLLMVPYAIAGVMMVRSMSAAAATGSVPGFGAAGLVGLVGFVCVIVLLVFYCLAGTLGDNRYGPDPYGAGAGG